jgi:restriction system protein
MVPDFQALMLPLMQHISDEKEYSMRETRDFLARRFNLADEELKQYTPSGNQKLFYNRVSWAKAYLKMAGFVKNTKDKNFMITDKGKQVLSTKPNTINIKFLKQFPEYLENSGRSKTEKRLNAIEIDDDAESNATPEEILESNYLKVRKNLAGEILSKIKLNSPDFFEDLVVKLLVKMGYGGTIEDAGKSIGRSGDEGIDGIIKEDRLGLDVIYIQAKRWESAVGRPDIQKFVGALAGQGAKKGVFITTSRFTDEAKEYQPKNETKIVLIDGEHLAELMIDFDIAVTTTRTFMIKRIDNDFFDED